MRLAIIRQRYTPFGGAERFVENALEALLERNVAITLYTRAWPQTRLQLIEPVIVDPPYIGSLWRDLSFARAIEREVGRTHLDLVQSHERLLTCDVYRAGDGVHAVWLEERLRGASVLKQLAVRANPWHSYILATERKLFASPWLQAVICNSNMVKDEIRAHFGVAEEKLRVVHNAVDSNAFNPALRESRQETLRTLNIPNDALIYLFVGSGFERKGVATAIEALAELPLTSHLIIVGRDKALESYRATAARAGVAKRVHFTGPVGDPRRLFGAADVFVLPTLYDPFPNAALEAMACALPVITTTKAGIAELVAANDAGLICESRDAAALAQHMRTLADPATRARIGMNARQAVLPLSPEAMTLKLVLLYKELLEASARAQKSDAARRLKAHRDAWAAKAGPPKPAAAATPRQSSTIDDSPPPGSGPPSSA
ncbi:MAG TPA: glycosyltransferase family 4 protein [Casimicrobiaceae bacterium]|nr:glycosyltransferase family 4 protein [Casimicrobiaceae bacterium]